MGDILPFKKKKASEKHEKRIMCQSGFHKWEIVTGQKFDVKQGKLISVYKCKRCGKIKNEAR